MFFGQIIKIFKFLEAKGIGWTSTEPYIKLTIFLIYFFQEILKNIFIIDLSLFLKLVFQFGIKPIQLLTMSKIQLEGPSAQHCCLVLLKRLSSKHFFFFVINISLAKQEPEHSFIDLESCSFFLEEERKLEPNIIIIITITFLTKSTCYFHTILHLHFLLTQLHDKYVLALILHLVNDLRHRLTTSTVYSLVHTHQIHIDRFLVNR